MKNLILSATILLIFCTVIHAQLESIKDTSEILSSTKKLDNTQATGDDVRIKDDDDNQLLRIIDEGDFGSIELMDGTPTTYTNKLYNNGGVLYFNGTDLGSGGASLINDLGDAIYDGSSLFVGEGSGGTKDDGGNMNTAVGKNALTSNTSGYSNTANGYFSLYSNTTGYGNTANGFGALIHNTTGNYNTANGSYSLRSNTTGYHNTANGYNALYSNTNGYHNTANGFQSLHNNTTGRWNTAIGYEALYSNTTGYHNTANGFQSLHNNTTGRWNTAIGYEALYSNTTGYHNTANGYNALYSNTAGYGNTANGRWALYKNTTGYGNTANGYSALEDNTEGRFNTSNGSNALLNNTTGESNTAIGMEALQSNRTGNHNTAVGHGSGPLNGYVNLQNSTALGYNARVTASKTIAIGNTLITSIKGQVGFSTFSDGRYKRNLREDVAGIDFIMGLRPVSYNVDIELLADKFQEDITFDENRNKIKKTASEEMQAARLEKSKERNTGFVAQEVEQLANELGFDFSGIDAPANEESMYSLRYAEFVVPLVKAMQEQQELIVDLQNQIDELKRGK